MRKANLIKTKDGDKELSLIKNVTSGGVNMPDTIGIFDDEEEKPILELSRSQAAKIGVALLAFSATQTRAANEPELVRSFFVNEDTFEISFEGYAMYIGSKFRYDKKRKCHLGSKKAVMELLKNLAFDMAASEMQQEKGSIANSTFPEDGFPF